jgi:hypothetical protein
MDVTFSPLNSLPPVPTSLNFQNNLIEDNVFTSPRYLYATQTYGPSISILLLEMQTNGPQPKVVSGNNVISGNVLPTNMPAPLIYPSTGFVDGGGNVCGSTSLGGFPIKCSSH